VVGGTNHVLGELGADLLVGRHLLDGSQHMYEPAIAFESTDGEGKVTLTQSRMTTLVAVGRRTSPVLDEEQSESLTRAGEIRLLGIETQEDFVRRHAGVETINEAHEEFLASHSFV
jgi:hypothetical protein